MAHRTNDTDPHMTLHPTHHFPQPGRSTSNHAADQYVNGIEAARRRIICVWEANTRVAVRIKAWMAWGVIDVGFHLLRRCWVICRREKYESSMMTGAARMKFGSCERVQ